MWRKLSLVVGIALFPVLCDASDLITQNLRLGDSSSEVRSLQRILNLDPATEVAVLGDGAKGLETEYFGLKTEAAVKRFQLKYKDKVLAPAGLTEPTGFVGMFTRKVLNELGAKAASVASVSKPTNTTQKTVSKSVVATATSPILTSNRAILAKNALAFYTKSPAELSQFLNMSAISKNFSRYASSSSVSAATLSAQFASTTFADRHKQIVSTLKKNYGIELKIPEPPKTTDVVLSGLSTYAAEPGQKIKIYGRNFSAYGNTVYWNSKSVVGVSSNASVIEVTIPDDIFGRVIVAVENADHSRSYPLGLVVAYKGRIIPSITDVDPKTADLNKPLNITGKNFGKTNQVVTTFGIFDGVVSTDGKTMSVNLGDIKSLKVYRSMNKSTTVTPLTIWISNENGTSEPYGPIKIAI